MYGSRVYDLTELAWVDSTESRASSSSINENPGLTRPMSTTRVFGRLPKKAPTFQKVVLTSEYGSNFGRIADLVEEYVGKPLGEVMDLQVCDVCLKNEFALPLRAVGCSDGCHSILCAPCMSRLHRCLKCREPSKQWFRYAVPLTIKKGEPVRIGDRLEMAMRWHKMMKVLIEKRSQSARESAIEKALERSWVKMKPHFRQFLLSADTDVTLSCAYGRGSARKIYSFTVPPPEAPLRLQDNDPRLIGPLELASHQGFHSLLGVTEAEYVDLLKKSD